MIRSARFPLLFFAVLCLTALLSVLFLGCASAPKYQSELVRWSHHYEGRMGLEPADIIFGNVSGPDGFKCGRVFQSRKWHGEFIGYDASNPRCRVSWHPRVLALHEQCHRRYAHLYRSELSPKGQHVEVEECMRHYR